MKKGIIISVVWLIWLSFGVVIAEAIYGNKLLFALILTWLVAPLIPLYRLRAKTGYILFVINTVLIISYLWRIYDLYNYK
jgi:hypothetical protein